MEPHSDQKAPAVDQKLPSSSIQEKSSTTSKDDFPREIEYPSGEFSSKYPLLPVYENEAIKSRHMRNPEFEPKTRKLHFWP